MQKVVLGLVWLVFFPFSPVYLPVYCSGFSQLVKNHLYDNVVLGLHRISPGEASASLLATVKLVNVTKDLYLHSVLMPFIFPVPQILHQRCPPISAQANLLLMTMQGSGNFAMSNAVSII